MNPPISAASPSEPIKLLREKSLGRRNWAAVCRFLFILLIAGNTLTLSGNITGDGPEVRLGYIIALIFFPWVWLVGKRSWRKPLARRIDRRAAYLILLLLLSSASAIYHFQFSGLPRSFFLSLATIFLYGGTAVTALRVFDAEEILSQYIVVAKWASAAAILQLFAWAVMRWDTTAWMRALGFVSRFGGEQGWLIRVNAWWEEPAHLAAFLSLAVLMCILPMPKPISLKIRLTPAWMIVIISAFALTFAASAVAIFPFLLLAYAPTLRRQWVLIPVTLFGVYWIAGSPAIVERLQALTNFNGAQVSDNLSVWALQSNYFSSIDSLKHAPLGLGAGTHLNSYKDWIGQWGIHNFDANALFLNARDGGSMPIRLLSEMGWPSLIIWFYAIYRVVRISISGALANSKVRYIEYIGIAGFLTLCARQGSYSMFDPWLMLLIPFAAIQ